MEITIFLVATLIFFICACCSEDTTVRIFMRLGVFFSGIFLFSSFGWSVAVSLILGVILTGVCWFFSSDSSSSSTSSSVSNNTSPSSVAKTKSAVLENTTYKNTINFINFCYKNWKNNKSNESSHAIIELVYDYDWDSKSFHVSAKHAIYDDPALWQFMNYAREKYNFATPIDIPYAHYAQERKLTQDELLCFPYPEKCKSVFLGLDPTCKIKQTDNLDFTIEKKLGAIFTGCLDIQKAVETEILRAYPTAEITHRKYSTTFKKIDMFTTITLH